MRMAKTKRRAAAAGNKKGTESKTSWSKFFKETKIEMRKVIWPSRHELLNYTLVVIVSVVVVTLLIVAVDFIFSVLSRLLVSVVG